MCRRAVAICRTCSDPVAGRGARSGLRCAGTTQSSPWWGRATRGTRVYIWTYLFRARGRSPALRTQMGRREGWHPTTRYANSVIIIISLPNNTTTQYKHAIRILTCMDRNIELQTEQRRTDKHAHTQPPKTCTNRHTNTVTQTQTHRHKHTHLVASLPLPSPPLPSPPGGPTGSRSPSIASW
jgi:hypothetical protein